MAVQTLSAVIAEIKANPGKVYVYALLRPDGAPFYVGVGTKRRVLYHERYATSVKQSAKLAIIREISTAGGHVGYEIAGWFSEWKDAGQEERRLIALYGRADTGKGPLTNRTNGGQGMSGVDLRAYPKRLEGARKAAEKNRGRKLTEEHRAKIGRPGRIVSDETRARQSASLKGRELTEEHRAKLSAAKKGRRPAQAVLDAMWAGGAKARKSKRKASMAAARKNVGLRKQQSKILV